MRRLDPHALHELVGGAAGHLQVGLEGDPAALDRIAGEVQRIEPEVAAAREAIWTPDKEKPEPEKKLWTPGSKETE
ncbi:MAG: hypothetical protein ACXVZ2_06140 [Gaiellaceae bacterium]